MAKILLLGFGERDREHLTAGKHEVELRTADWGAGGERPFLSPQESEVVVYQVNGTSADVQPPAGASSAVQRLVEEGGKVICFLGQSSLYQLTGIVGSLPDIHFQDNTPPESFSVNPQGQFHEVFEKFQASVMHAYKLFPEAVPNEVWDKESQGRGRFEILAKSPDGFPVSLMIRQGKGCYLLLPWFGPKNIEVVDSILKTLDAPPAPAPEAPFAWLDGDEYAFPGLKELFSHKEEERKRHEEAMAEIERKIREMKDTEQEAFHRLLKSEGPELKKAVIHAMSFLGWGRVVDVDGYWKNVIRDKEEDIWLMESESRPVEVSMRKDFLLIVLVRGNKNWATDDECGLLQKFKGRRMQEFDNTKMKAVLIGNYFLTTEPKLRGNPFSTVQTEEAQKDGNGFLTTFELFKAIQAIKENRADKGILRNQIKEKSGLIQLEY